MRRVLPITAPAGKTSGIRDSVCSLTPPLIKSRAPSGSWRMSTPWIGASYRSRVIATNVDSSGCAFRAIVITQIAAS